MGYVNILYGPPAEFKFWPGRSKGETDARGIFTSEVLGPGGQSPPCGRGDRNGRPIAVGLRLVREVRPDVDHRSHVHVSDLHAGARQRARPGRDEQDTETQVLRDHQALPKLLQSL